MKTFDSSMQGTGNFAMRPAGSAQDELGRVKGRIPLVKRCLRWVLVVLLAGMLVAFAMDAGRMLVVDDPQPSDVILVLAGETERRPERALQLLDQGYGRRVVMDVPACSQDLRLDPSGIGREICSGASAGGIGPDLSD